MDNPQVKITPFNNPEAFEELETGYLTLNLTLKPLNSKYGLKTINHLQSLLKEKDMEKYIEEDKLIINTPITPLKFDLHQEPSIGTTCFFSKSKGYIGYEGKSYSLELKNHLKSFEKAPNPDNNNPKSNEILNKKAENTGYLRLESITEWLEENRPKTKKKRKIQSEFDEKEEELTKKGEEKLLEGIKPLGIKKKRKKNINRLLNKLKR